MNRSLVVSGLFAMACSVCFADQVVEKPVSADTPEKFATVADGVRKEMGPGGRYEYIRPDQKGRVEADLNLMVQLLQQSGSAQAMRDEQKVQLFNTQENLNGILTHSDKNRLICENVQAAGSLLRTNKCRTLGDMERDHADSKQMMNYKEEKASIPLFDQTQGKGKN